MLSIDRILNRALRDFTQRTSRRPNFHERRTVEDCILRGFSSDIATQAALGHIETDF